MKKYFVFAGLAVLSITIVVVANGIRNF